MASSIFRSTPLFLLFSSALSFTPCQLLGPTYPSFTLDTEDADLSAALKNLTRKFDNLMRTGNSENGPVTSNTTTVSIALFSANEGNDEDQPFFWEYHWTAPEYKKSTGQFQNVTKDSIYRMGGLTEAFTIWSLLLGEGDRIFNDPVIKYLPELTNGSTTDSLGQVQWKDVTVGQLASHMSGLPRDYCSSDLTLQWDTQKTGFPQHASFHRPCCGDSKCSQSEFIQQLAKRAPVAPSGLTPIYSNMAFQLLGYIDERITGESFEKSIQSKILKPLGLTETTIFAPKDASKGVIPVGQKASGWSAQLPGTEASTSMFTSLENLASAGKAIVNSTLLPSAQTNRWLKPATDTSNKANAVGYPFTIYHGGEYPNKSPMVDIYTILSNEGDNEGLYSSYLGMVPDMGIGYAILSADTKKHADLNTHADFMSDVLEAIQKIALKQALGNYGGKYASSGFSNTSISIEGKKNLGWGLYIEDFVSKGKNFRETLAPLLGYGHAVELSIHLYPTRLVEKTSTGSKEAFRAVFQDVTELADSGTPTCVSWMDVDKYQYADHGLDEFIFTLDTKGVVVGVEIPALDVALQKKN